MSAQLAVPLDAVLDIKLQGMRDLFDEKLRAIQRASNMSNALINRRLNMLQANAPFTRAEHELYMKPVEADLRVLREARAEFVGARSEIDSKASQTNVNLALLISTISAVTSIGGIVISIIIRVYGK